MPFPPWPSIPAPSTWAKGGFLNAAQLRSDVANAVLMFTQPPTFTGTMTGQPAPFTVNNSGTYPQISAPGTAYPLNQPVVFYAVPGNPYGAFPPGITAGQVYYAYNPVGGLFGISTVPGASSPYTGFGTTGGGWVAQTQLITQNAWTGISLDTEPGAGDAWGGHQVTANQPWYYGMLPGIYLADFTFPANWTGGGGAVSAGLFTQEGTGPVTTVGGQCGPLSGTANRYATVSVTRLLSFSATGTYAGTGNNYAGAAAWQDNPSAITPLAIPSAAVTRYPQMNAEWVASLTANPALQVPDNDTWPSAGLGRAFLNKNIRDTVAFLAARPVMEAYLSSTAYTIAPVTTSPGATGPVIPLDTPHIDTWGAFNAPSGLWTAPVPGRYDIYAQFPVRAASTSVAVAAGFSVLSAGFGVAATTWGYEQQALTASNEINCAVARRQVRLNAGDQVSLSGYLNDTGSVNLQVPGAGATWQARLITIWRGK